MKKDLRIEEKISKNHGEKTAKKGKEKSNNLDVMKLTDLQEQGMLGKEVMRPLSSALDDTNETHLVPLEPTHNYILRDFLRTNNMLNQSMSVLNEQNKQNIKDWEEEKGASKKREILDKAAHDTRINAMALAQVVQAKVQYIKAVKGVK